MPVTTSSLTPEEHAHVQCHGLKMIMICPGFGHANSHQMRQLLFSSCLGPITDTRLGRIESDGNYVMDNTHAQSTLELQLRYQSMCVLYNQRQVYKKASTVCRSQKGWQGSLPIDASLSNPLTQR